ncbi:hypothetical protein SAMN05216574_11225 [Blastococcus tunisiensis]|uniref:Uncharacterized protein n=2 Tax=Blastococcus tunisiensis TaxID=1798228 RepID=A0A1I2HYW5_9ACTN|nr:hypothetical protein SAMN05216574_11225 [Blastococcus sp. DSM 46838]
MTFPAPRNAVGLGPGLARGDRRAGTRGGVYLLTMSSSEYVVGRRGNAQGEPVGERHAVLAVATRKEPPFRAECGAKVDVVDGDWPPAGGDEHACPVCSRDTSAPWA